MKYDMLVMWLNVVNAAWGDYLASSRVTDSATLLNLFTREIRKNFILELIPYFFCLSFLLDSLLHPHTQVISSFNPCVLSFSFSLLFFWEICWQF